MKNIISASRRTDIPTFYYQWLQDCLKKEYVEVPNPMYPEKISKVNLCPENIHSIVLWSKNFSNVAINSGYLDNYDLYFQYTITNYSKFLEPNVPTYSDTLKTLERLRYKYNSNQFNIRFDPIIISNKGENNPTPNVPGQARLIAFEQLLKDLKQLDMNNCRITTSYISMYKHVKNKINNSDLDIIDLNQQYQKEFIQEMVNIASSYNQTIYTCSNPILEGIEGVKKGHCIDGDLLDSIFNKKSSKSKNNGQRISCGCSKSIDIGNYTQVCNHNCLYCYALK